MTGGLFFVPSADFLDDPPDPPEGVAATRAVDEECPEVAIAPPPDRDTTFAPSLGIGDLKGSDV